MPRPEEVSRERRRIALGGLALDYLLVRRRGRRGVGLKVDETGLAVNAPLGVPLSRIEALVRESERWVLRKVAEWSPRQVPAARWEDGAALPYLGEWLRLRVATGPRAGVAVAEAELRVTAREHGDQAVRRAVLGWYRQAALAHLAPRTHALAHHAGLEPPRVLLSSARSRWGSCNARREVRLAWRLVKARPALIDYVVCHELAHLRHMDHSRAFWAEVGRQCPDYRALRAELEATDHLYRSF